MYNELIDALRYHADATIHACDGCMYDGKTNAHQYCFDMLISDAADEIERLTDEVDRKDIAYAIWSVVEKTRKRKKKGRRE